GAWRRWTVSSIGRASTDGTGRSRPTGASRCVSAARSVPPRSRPTRQTGGRYARPRGSSRPRETKERRRGFGRTPCGEGAGRGRVRQVRDVAAWGERIGGKIAVGEYGCWEWAGRLNRQGYGIIWFDGENRLAHRVVWRILVGSIDPDLHAHHTCHNSRCVNPA